MRFREFDDKWENKQIKNILNICHGRDYKHLGKGKFPVLGTGGVITYVNDYLCKWSCVLIGRKGTINKPQFMNTPFWSVDTLFYSKPHNGQLPKFQYYLFQTINWEKYNEGSGVPSLSASTIENIQVQIPSTQEQQKIAGFLSLIDDRIEAQNKIIEDLKVLKKELMDYILNSCDFIELSIQEFIDAGYARIIKANELGYFNGSREYLSTSSVGENGIECTEGIITYENRPSRASMKPLKNSVWFAKMKGSVKVYQSVDQDEDKYVLSTGFYGLLCNENKINAQWILELFKSEYFNWQKDRFSEGSSMSGVKDNQLSDIQLKIFLDKNQEKYHTDKLRLISNKIKLEMAILETLNIQKRFLLNAMFI